MPESDGDGERQRVEHVVVVIPARDEEDTIEAAVRAVLVSAEALPDDVRVGVVVVADACVDATAARARSAGADVVVSAAGRVGSARRLGCVWALATAGPSADPARLWIATTDADSTVPVAWLPAQLDAARTGDVFVGTIRLTEADRLRHVVWSVGYAARPPGGPHGHVHGASLGVRGSAYVEAGGFGDLAAHEDADLLDRLVGGCAVAVWDDSVPVTTSARHASRVADGVGPDLAASLAPAASPPAGRVVPAWPTRHVRHA
jgi:glycosyltransferase involved in cell wall biosynthesis